jgi:hypothetical protein
MDQLEEGIKIVVAGKLELTFLRLMKIPERINFDCIESSAFESEQSITPEFARNPGILHAGGNDERSAAVN